MSFRKCVVLVVTTRAAARVAASARMMAIEASAAMTRLPLWAALRASCATSAACWAISHGTRAAWSSATRRLGSSDGVRAGGESGSAVAEFYPAVAVAVEVGGACLPLAGISYPPCDGCRFGVGEDAGFGESLAVGETDVRDVADRVYVLVSGFECVRVDVDESGDAEQRRCPDHLGRLVGRDDYEQVDLVHAAV